MRNSLRYLKGTCQSSPTEGAKSHPGSRDTQNRALVGQDKVLRHSPRHGLAGPPPLLLTLPQSQSFWISSRRGTVWVMRHQLCSSSLLLPGCPCTEVEEGRPQGSWRPQHKTAFALPLSPGHSSVPHAQDSPKPPAPTPVYCLCATRRHRKWSPSAPSDTDVVVLRLVLHRALTLFEHPSCRC